MKITFTNHLKIRLNQRGISVKIVKEVLSKGLENYWDELRKHHIVIAEIDYQSKIRKVLVAYDKIGSIIEAITIHPITNNEIKQGLKSGRWSHEKDKK